MTQAGLSSLRFTFAELQGLNLESGEHVGTMGWDHGANAWKQLMVP